MLSHFVVSVLGFLLAIGILITVHEFGHFWVARLFGIRVLRFSIGFGRPFFRWFDKFGTEYVLSMIPLGGYVSLFGERGGDIPISERPMAFSEKPVFVRIAVLVAGPFFNLGFAILAYWLMFMIGIASVAPILGPVPLNSPAYKAGFRQNQEIVAIEGKSTPNFESVSLALISAMGEKQKINVDLREGAGPIESKQLALGNLEEKESEQDLLKELGIVPNDPLPPVVGNLKPGYPAELSGIKVGDEIIAIEGQTVHSRSEASQIIQTKMDKRIQLTIKRGKEKQEISLMPVRERLEDGKEVGFIGILYDANISPPKEYLRTMHYGPVKALVEATKRTAHFTLLTLEMLKKMILGTVSLKHLSGPISIAQYAGQTVRHGLEYFLSFLAVVSISLGVLNLLPIPLLDGGHILYCLWELVTGRPVSEQAQIVGLWFGGLIILLITVIAFYNDISNL